MLELEYGRFGIPVADAHIFLDVDIQDAGRNVDLKGYRDYVGNDRDVYESQDGIQQRARAKYLQYAEQMDNIFVIPCMEEGRLLPEPDIAMRVEDTLLHAGLL